MITDPLFYVCAIPAILLFAMAKGGLGAGLGLLSVPLMSLVVSPVQAAAIMLPLLLVMDASAVWTYRGQWNVEQVKIMVPGALLGIFIGACTFQYLSEDAVKVLIALIALGFSLNHFYQRHKLKRQQKELPPATSNPLKGAFWGALSGFTSFGVHAGGTPASVYLLPLRMPKKTLMATFALFFAIVNIVKLGAFAWLGQLQQANLLTSLVLFPLAPIGVKIGYYLLHKISETLIYTLCYFFLVMVGIKLFVEGIPGLLS